MFAAGGQYYLSDVPFRFSGIGRDARSSNNGCRFRRLAADAGAVGFFERSLLPVRALRGFLGFCGSACRGCTAEAASTETAPERQRPQRPRHSGRQLLSDRLLRQIQWSELLGAFASTIWSRVAASPFTCYAWMQPQALHESRRQLLFDRLLRQLQ